MLEKLVLFVVTLVVTVASSFAPPGFLVRTEVDANLSPAVDAPLHTDLGAPTEYPFATVDGSGFNTFARLSILSVSINGHPVTRDEWGSGYLSEITFQIGIRRSEAAGLRFGTEFVPVKPTDNFTVRGFTGRYQVLNVDDASATLSLEGTVQVTGFNAGALKGLKTLAPEERPGARENLAYVVLEGKKGEAFSVTRADSLRTFTGGAADTPEGPGIGHLVVRNVHINGEVIHDNAHGEGAVASIRFDVVPQGDSPSSIHFASDELSLKEGGRVDVKGFLGTYVVFTIPGGFQKIKLDGVAHSISTDASAVPDPSELLNNRVPDAAFTFDPPNPTTSTEVRFQDQSTDPDRGIILLRRWDFGDNTGGSAEAFPKHRFTQKGNYTVTLEVTDNALGTNRTQLVVSVANSPPQSDFTWVPKDPTTYYDIPFQDTTKDIDGTVRSWLWDFGDGFTSAQRNPSHRYLLPGIYNVSLTTTDNDGATNRITKVVFVQNSPPRPDFAHDPAFPLAQTPILFYDTSSDLDGTIASCSWTFPSLAPLTGCNVTHIFPRSGTFHVSHTVRDDRGEAATITKPVQILNQPPTASFLYHPTPVRAGKVITFVDRSTDSDGTIATWAWDFGDGGTATGREVTHVFTVGGNFTVTLTVTDNEGGRGTTTDNLAVDGAAPRSAFEVNPRLAATYDVFTFLDRSTDSDGTIVRWNWSFGDGGYSVSQNPTHVFTDNCVCVVNLTIEDDDGKTDWIVQEVNVLNRPPVPTVLVSNLQPFAGATVTFNATATDRDGHVTGYTWDFGDGQSAAGANVQHVFQRSGTYRVILAVTDDDGARATRTTTMQVKKVPPVANFTFTPAIPLAGANVLFKDASIYSSEVRPASWLWEFGDSATSIENETSHRYLASGTYTVRLTVTDDAGNQGTATRTIRINDRPVAAFSYSPLQPEPGTPIQFTDFSRDDLGITAWAWTFGSFGSNNTQNPVFAFPSTGTHTVTLRVTDTEGAVGERRLTINVQNRPPRADWSVSPTTPVQNQAAAFTDLSTDMGGVVSAWSWDFGDGFRSSVQHPSHTFTAPGRYSVVLTAYDPNGASGVSAKAPLRVVGDQSYTLWVEPVLPDGTALDLTVPGTEVRVRNAFTGQIRFPGQGVTLYANGSALVVFQPETWAPGDQFTVTVTVPQYGASGLVQSDYATSLNALKLQVPLTAPMKLSLSVDAPTKRGLLSQAAGGTPEGHVFTDQSEMVYVTACASWLNNAPIRNAIVRVTVTYTGSEEPVGPLESFYEIDPVLQRTTEDNVTGLDGCARLPVPAPLVGPRDGGGPYLPGWYHVTGETLLASSTLAIFDPRTAPEDRFFEDPLGAASAVDPGILL